MGRVCLYRDLEVKRYGREEVAERGVEVNREPRPIRGEEFR